MSVVFLCYSLKYMILNLQMVFIFKSCIPETFLIHIPRSHCCAKYLYYFIQQLCEQQSFCSPEQRANATTIFLFVSKAVQVFPVVRVELCGYILNFQICEYTLATFFLTGINCLKFIYPFRNWRNGVGFGGFTKILLSACSRFYLLKIFLNSHAS